MVRKGSLPHSKQPAKLPDPEPDQTSLCLSIPILEDLFNYHSLIRA